MSYNIIRKKKNRLKLSFFTCGEQIILRILKERQQETAIKRETILLNLAYVLQTIEQVEAECKPQYYLPKVISIIIIELERQGFFETEANDFVVYDMRHSFGKNNT